MGYKLHDPLCQVDGCSKPRATTSRSCAMHHARKMRTGTFDKREPAMRNLGVDGYWTLRGMMGHPRADRKGTVREHVWVLYEKIGPGPHPCHWCGTLKNWGGKTGIHADHLDEVKGNNDPDNLVPSCGPCNRLRTQGIDRLSYADVCLIRERCAAGETQKDVAIAMGVSSGWVCEIVNNQVRINE